MSTLRVAVRYDPPVMQRHDKPAPGPGPRFGDLLWSGNLPAVPRKGDLWTMRDPDGELDNAHEVIEIEWNLSAADEQVTVWVRPR